jgi:hypothetical protein
MTLAMAVGANAVVFSVLNGLILRPLNARQAQSLYGIERASDKAMSQSNTSQRTRRCCDDNPVLRLLS